MKKKVTVSIFLGIFVCSVFCQNEEYTHGGRFLKKIGYNFTSSGVYNLNDKDHVEMLFFGDFNAKFEFSHEPSFEGASGFRVVRDSLNKSCILEVKCIENYDEITKEMSKKYPMIATPAELLFSDDDNHKYLHRLIEEHNGTVSVKQQEESLKLFKVENLSVHVSDQFAEKLYRMNVSLIGGFKGKGVPPEIADGYTVTFRTVVDDEVWSLWIHMPQGNALKMADLCRQIITDAKIGKLDESKYISILDTFED